MARIYYKDSFPGQILELALGDESKAEDAIAALSTIIINRLYLTDALQLWHLYGGALLNGGEIQQLAILEPVMQSESPLTEGLG